MAKYETAQQRRSRRTRAAIRKNARGRARLSVFRSNKHISVQLIDDTKGVTIVSASTQEKDLKLKSNTNIDAAKKIGKIVAERAKSKKIKDVVFDRGGYLYHGRVKALADAAREGGLVF